MSRPPFRCLFLGEAALALLFALGAVPRPAFCAVALPCSVATCCAIRWRAYGGLKASLAWAFVPVAAGAAVWLAVG